MKLRRESDDPVLSPDEMCEDIGICRPSWYRHWRYHPKLKILHVTKRRIGARRSNWRAVVAEEQSR
jgi:hypothetical protein